MQLATRLDGAAHRASYVTMHARAYGELIGVLWDERAGAAAPRALELAEASRAQEVMAMLDPDQALVEYVSTDARLFAVAVTRDTIALVPLPGAAEARTLAARTSFFRQLVNEAARDDEIDVAARRLYADLVAPVLEALPGRARGTATLVISPDGPLLDMPFDALLGPDGFVVDRWRVVIVPSASVLAARAPSGRRSGSALVVAAPDAPGYGALPYAREEAAIVSDHFNRGASTVLVGDAATVAAVAGLDLERFALLHFAGHAITDDVVPLRSALLLAAGGGDDGHWRASAIYKLRLDADLVVLSACRTSAGTVARGEGAMSLARAFVYSGARATVATQWDVDDAAGPAFARVLYERLAAGDRLVDAVSGAKRELRRRGAPPRAWAAYALTGDPDGRVGMVNPINSWTIATRGAAGLAAALLLGILIARRARVRRRVAAGEAGITEAS